MSITITSTDNSSVKQACKLVNSAACRRKAESFAVEGVRLCCDAAQSGLELKQLYFTEAAAKRYGSRVEMLQSKAGRSFEVSDAVMNKLCDTLTPQGVFCVYGIPANRLNMSAVSGKIIALENVSDPSNLGAVARTAEALGISGMILSGDCCDVYNPKCLRASMGAWFRLPFAVVSDLPSALSDVRRGGMPVYGAVPDSQAADIRTVDFSDGAVFVIGNEGAGLTQSMKEQCTQLVTIPMLGRAESLNAASAAAIIMWEMVR